MNDISVKSHAVDPVSRASALAPAIAALGNEIENGRRLPPALVDKLHEARLFRMLLPRSVGGDEVEPGAYIRATEELARPTVRSAGACRSPTAPGCSPPI